MVRGSTDHRRQVSSGRKARFHPSAVEEARVAHDYYCARSERAGIVFLSELDRAIVAISESPRRWRLHSHGTRHFLMRRFPFLVIYQQLDETTLEIVAIAHARRRPGYWSDRV